MFIEIMSKYVMLIALCLGSLVVAGCGQESSPTFIENIGAQIDLPAGWKVDVQWQKAEIYNANDKRTITLELVPASQDDVLPASVDALSQAMTTLGYEVVTSENFANGFGGSFKKPTDDKTTFIYIADIEGKKIRCTNGVYFEETDLDDDITLCKTITSPVMTGK